MPTEIWFFILSDSDAAFRGDNRDENQNFQKILNTQNGLERSNH